MQRAIEAGDTETGVSIMAMEAGLDTGPILMSRRLNIRSDHTSGQLLRSSQQSVLKHWLIASIKSKH